MMRKLLSFLFGLMLGALVGAVLAMLLAPAPGDDLRRQVQVRMEQVVEEGKRARDERKAELEAQLEALKKGKVSTS